MMTKSKKLVEKHFPYEYEIVDTPTGRIHHIKLTDALAYLYKKDTLYGNDENVNRQIYEI